MRAASSGEALAEWQRRLAAELTGASCREQGLLAPRLRLERKRSRAVERLLPGCRRVLDRRWEEVFHRHASGYSPEGILHHVDDAWELARRLRRSRDSRLAAAAHDDLLELKLHSARDPSSSAYRIRPRRGLFMGMTRQRPRQICLRLHGSRGRVLRLTLTGPGRGLTRS